MPTPATATRPHLVTLSSGYDLTYRFPLIVETLAGLRPRSCIIDGEAVACDDNGMTNFDRVRYRRNDASVFLYAFDLIELNGGRTNYSEADQEEEMDAMRSL